MKTPPKPVSAQEFDKLFQAVCNWGRWGADDERGTLNYITPAEVRRAASLVRSGRSVSMAVPINKVAGPDNPHPAVHYMVQSFDVASRLAEPQFSLDYLACEFHGDCHTHIDALCHIAYKGQLYNGKTRCRVLPPAARRSRTSRPMLTALLGAEFCWIFPDCAALNGSNLGRR